MIRGLFDLLQLKRLPAKPTATEFQEGQLRYERLTTTSGKFYIGRYVSGGTYAWVDLTDDTLIALAAYNTNGLLTQTAADTFTGRTITGTTNEVEVTNGSGVAGNPTIGLPDNVTITSNLTLGGKIATTGTAPTGAAGAAAGASPGTVTITGTDTAFNVDFTLGTGTGTGVLFSVTFATARGSSNYVVVGFAGDNDAGLLSLNYENRLTGGFDVRTGTAPVDSTNYRWSFLVIDHDG